MSHRRTIATAAALLSAAALLTGCSGTGTTKAGPTDAAKPATASSTPSPTVGYPTQAPVGPPKSEADAYAAAKRTVDGYMKLNGAAYADPERGADALQGYEQGAALSDDEKSLAGEVKTGGRLIGEVTFVPVASKTVYATVGTGASAIENGSVKFYGCASYAAGAQIKNNATTPPAPARDFPVSLTVQYFAPHKVWYVIADSTADVNGVTC